MQQEPDAPTSPDRDRAIRFGRRFDWIITGTIVVIAVVFIYLLQSLPQRATFFPWFITISILLVGGVYGWSKIQRPDAWDDQYALGPNAGNVEQDTGPSFLLKHKRGIIRVLLIFAALIVASMFIGPKFAVPLFLTIMLWTGGERPIVAVLSGIGFWLAVHFIFGQAMSINLPTGYLSDALF